MEADLILVNGRIFTQNASGAYCEALAIKGGEIALSGTNEQVEHILISGGLRIDLEGACVIPGLVDAHVHMLSYGRFLTQVDLNPATSVEHAGSIILSHQMAKESGWITGFGWDQTRWAGGTFPTAKNLDTLFPSQPLYMVARSGHAAWVNTKALEIAGIDAATSEPPGGRISREASGKPDGVLFEDSAMSLVRTLIPTGTPELKNMMLNMAIAQGHRAGLTGIHDVDGIDAFKAFQSLNKRGSLTLRVLKNLPVEYLDAYVASGLMFGFGDEMLRIGGVKQFADGALGPRTAWMLNSYEQDIDHTGIATVEPGEMLELALTASRAGLPSVIHAIGDRAVRSVLDVLHEVRRDERTRGITAEQMRHRIEHVQLIDPDDCDRLAKDKIIASMQPTHAISDMDMADQHWGRRATYAYGWREQLKAGAILAFGSDAPIEAINPLAGIQAAVTRRRHDGSPSIEGWHGAGGRCLTVKEALAAFTLGPAYAAGLESRVGRLSRGFLADLTVVASDLEAIDPLQISSIEVLGTMVNGRWVHGKLPGMV